ncbi:MAG: dihydrolipoamide acetyltransferase family protein [Vicinamibacterales bacterium]
MASRVVMPKLSDTMEEGKILRWIKKEGEKVETGQALAEVETDKATVEMESYTNGVMRKIVAPEGATVRVGNLIAVVGGADEDISGLLEEGGPPPTQAKAQAAIEKTPAPPAPARQQPLPPSSTAAPAVRREAVRESLGVRGLRASPLALRMAAEAGVDLAGIRGSGPQGRIIKRDIEKAVEEAGKAESAEPAVAEQARTVTVRAEGPEVREVELSSMRRTIAKRLVQSKAPVPHFYLTVDVAMDRAWEAYRALRDAEQSSVSINDIVIKATASALRRHPELNASFGGDHIKQHNRVHIGMAVSIDDGLITPVIRDADLKTLEEISAESRRLSDRARARRLQPNEYTGATFSISNLGMMGIEEFSAIINPPEGAILAVGAVRQAPVVERGELRIGYRMKLTLSVDHRVADGAMGARFLQTLKRLLENPLLIG